MRAPGVGCSRLASSRRSQSPKQPSRQYLGILPRPVNVIWVNNCVGPSVLALPSQHHSRSLLAASSASSNAISDTVYFF